MNELAQLMEILHDPLLQQALVLLAALFGGLLLMTVAARIEVTRGNTPGRALAAYHTEAVDTPLEKLGATLPIVVRLDGTAAEAGRAIIAERAPANVVVEPTMLSAAQRAVELAKEAS